MIKRIANACRVVLLIALCAPAAGQTVEPSDGALHAAIESQLLNRLDRRASAAIDVMVTNGVATLRGEVATLLAKHRAVEVAGIVRGVRAVVDLMTVTPDPRPDALVRSNVESAIARSATAEADEIRVTVRSGVVELEGTVESMAERISAARAAASVAGVRDVRNSIAIADVMSRPDDEIEADVISRLRYDARIDSRRMSVEARHGNVILSGEAASVAERVIATNLAWVPGVKVVTDRLRVVPTPGALIRRDGIRPPSDEALRRAVIASFVVDPRVNSFMPEVTVSEAVVTLRGLVGDLEARNAAEDDAHHVVGVRAVRNRLEVRGIPRSDAAIARTLRDALLASAAVDAAAIEVSVDAGTVTLDGSVATPYARSAAEEIASQVEGVVDIVNRLTPGKGGADFDAIIERRLRDAIRWHALIDAANVALAVENGVVTITGTVASPSDGYLIAEQAREAGASRVVNRLVVPPVRGAAAQTPATDDRWHDSVAELLVSLLIGALCVTGMVLVHRTRGLRPSSGMIAWVFVIAVLSTWAVATSIEPFGSRVFNVPWMTFLAVGIVVSMILIAALRPPSTEGAMAQTPPGPLFWILLAALMLAIVADHLRGRHSERANETREVSREFIG